MQKHQPDLLCCWFNLWVPKYMQHYGRLQFINLPSVHKILAYVVIC